MGLGPSSGGPFAEAVSGLKLSCLGHGTLGDMSTSIHKPTGTERPVLCTSTHSQAHAAAPCPRLVEPLQELKQQLYVRCSEYGT